jgi:hypothetical protein
MHYAMSKEEYKRQLLKDVSQFSRDEEITMASTASLILELFIYSNTSKTHMRIITGNRRLTSFELDAMKQIWDKSLRQ